MASYNRTYVVRKHWLDGERLLETGFSLYKDGGEAGDGGYGSCEEIWAIPIRLDPDSPISKGLRKVLEEANAKSVEETGKPVVELGEDEIERTVTECQLCVSAGEEWKDPTKGVLFINDPSGTAYYEKGVIDAHCGELVAGLVEKGVVFVKCAGKRKRKHD